ncbi:MAG TPA: tRNA dihydrouridine(20/20a) synthase DusA [Alphaproteobacteria bacterium]|jgi:tRNA-dihydrouridine synthase A|nr:tRNA dihydrouridine(20/20a) synthase DusA [Alphaproteobacteria bacterium]HIM73048.1 tRNA dihydrouridine(20/20a) synthase DusA [Alphaproteobacteria bacterium]HIN93454.1 tRNA dihydrouridine(20/20a) synthase DusA [Alphaproteobacteria bacterium]
MNNHRICVAPMMDRTDRHERYFLRLISSRALFYTEMVTSDAVLYGNPERVYAFDPAEHPIALQLGGSDLVALAEAAARGAEMGYDEINLNIGCPSKRVSVARFGACLMADPVLVASCTRAMSDAVDIPVTVKTRIGIDDHESYEDLSHFVRIVAEGGCRTFIIHARKAILSGISPKENRTIPPLKYEFVYRLKNDFPELEIVLNGGVLSLEAAAQHLEHVDGVMIGRAAYRDPYLLADVDRRFYCDSSLPRSRHQVIDALKPYIAQRLEKGIHLSCITRHIMGLFHGQPNGRAWRRHLGENACRPGADFAVIDAAMAELII